ncbi:phage Gp37/Gp68 family protein [Burkholderia cepacia]|uniref:phage Gp37/Gp68 family protein n=1 Tax=Burkholderia cepacia TaxID=292 RepID=UPI000F5EC761|nr:phage Gp37/Gp68 family protein [Burkholderia cepacia]RRA01868.1 phage Gp37/Gp68 family protein [Burkholderia cepacia]RRA04900.1 phage Gp37/Gp68 family protein [Burkholderia cepacia]
MSENSKIEWTDHTFNPWEGCQKVGPGCDHCYAETRNARFAGGMAVNWGPGAPRRRTSPANWRKPLAWNAAHAEFFAAHGRRQRVFCASLADVFDNEVDLLWRRDLFRLIADTPNLDWLLLTKRIGNVPTMLRHIGVEQLPPNVWLGATVVNQAEADRDIPKLLAVPARVRFLSMEPLLGAVDVRFAFADAGVICCRTCGYRTNNPSHGPCPNDGSTLRSDVGVDWVIVGGESGPGARPMHPDWARDLRDQCAAAGVPFLFKQWGEWTSGENTAERRTGIVKTADWFGGQWMFGETDLAGDGGHIDDEPDLYRVGKKVAGRHLDGRTHDEFPEVR